MSPERGETGRFMPVLGPERERNRRIMPVLGPEREENREDYARLCLPGVVGRGNMPPRVGGREE